MNIEVNISTEPFFSQLWWGKGIMQEKEWAVKKCMDCGGELELIVNNEFEEVKQCKECGRKTMLLKKNKGGNRMIDVKIKSGYARHDGKTVDGLIEILSLLSKQGYGDNEVAFGYDGNLAYTTTDGEYEIEEETIWFKEQDY